MKAKTSNFLIIVLVIAGAFVNFFCTNMVLSDVSNMFHDHMFISSIPAFIFASYFVLAILYILRYARRPQYKKKMSEVHTTAWIIFAIIGLVSSVLSGIVVYKSFTAPYPFPYYVIIAIVVHLAALIFSFVWKFKCRKMEEDPEKRKRTIKHVLFTLVSVVVIYLALNRLGALIWAPIYVQARSLSLTWPFYISLLLPLALLLHMMLYISGVFVKHPAVGIIYDIIVLIMTIGLNGVVLLLGMRHSDFIAAISPAFALDRLATKPILIFVVLGLEIIFGIYLLGLSIKLKGRIERGEPI